MLKSFVAACVQAHVTGDRRMTCKANTHKMHEQKRNTKTNENIMQNMERNENTERMNKKRNKQTK